MTLKEVFRPTPKKLILPVIISIFLIFLFSITYYQSSVSLDYYCRFFIKSELGDQGAINLDSIRFSNDLNVKEDIASKHPLIAKSNNVIAVINPFYPTDCTLSQKEDCYSSSYEKYQCAKKINLVNSDSEFKKQSLSMLSLSILFFFIAGYILSCLVSLTFKSKQNSW
jgi:hypothetical protein